MKKYIVFLITMYIMIMSTNVVKAKTSFVSGLSKCSNSNLVAKCVYSFKYKSGSTYYFKATIKDGSVLKKTFTYKEGSVTRTVETENYRENLVLNLDFTKSDDSYGCPSYIYLYNPTSSNKKKYNPGSLNYLFLNGRFTDWNNKTSVSKFGKIKINTSKSCINSTKAKKSSNTSVTSDKYNTCYYNFSSPIYLQINKSKKSLQIGYDKNAWSGYSFKEITYNKLDSNANCPAYLCNIGQSKIVMSNNGHQAGGSCQGATLSYETEYKCPIITVRKYLLDQMTKIYKNKSSSAQQKTNASTTISTLRTEIKQYCQQRVKNDDYPGENNCTKDCINVGEEISGILYDDQDTNKCTNLTNRIMNFIYNILKWMKYIAPVLVIILGIFDFIKALASSDDDAMKKAQKRFVIRLVAAVLLFLLPLIIDYILRIFNLVDPNCDITNMFK